MIKIYDMNGNMATYDGNMETCDLSTLFGDESSPFGDDLEKISSLLGDDRKARNQLV